MAATRPKLNSEAYRIVKVKEDAFTKSGTVLPSNFSIVYMGDTHIGMSGCSQSPESKYEQLLKKIISSNTNGDILCIVHGGDATDHGIDNLQIFIDKTWKTLYDPYTNDKDKIPLFLNTGNHDFKLIKVNGQVTNYDLTAFNNLVAADELFKSDPSAPHPDVQVVPLNKLYLRIVLLNTGYGNRGSFGSVDIGKFEKEIKEIDKWMTYLQGVSNKIRFIVDMHIPPQIGTIGNGNPSHVLNNQYSTLFSKDILDKHYRSMITVSSHHRHCKPPTRYYDPHYKFDFFLTAAGGNCDTVCGGKCNPKCSSQYKYPYHAIRVNYNYVKNILAVDPIHPYDIISL
ncbi:metallophosphoesterase family protein [Anaeromicropila herbilytica]|uniref:Calcineurin-like phosphoesterase domain-containing protein n=1 Tax=Anaeromicropila herbilytica TaxID=2785025 RepID=A0A7R7ICK4_9FIRM|nr:metallophosphoesterase [Anaeromicropila herbilytica]BCN29078.1 hypothetical protein bsdtb5_03730 [Anaeromicropila herbilytica]